MVQLIIHLLLLLSPNWATPQNIKLNDEQVECLAKNVYFESRNQPLIGQIAVAHVTFNRTDHELFPDSICEVVWEIVYNVNTHKKVPQFSWTLDGKSDVPTEHVVWNNTKNLAHLLIIIKRIIPKWDVTQGAVFYHANYTEFKNKPANWVRTVKIYDHIFYKIISRPLK